jgi:NNP family nitrate/nitrite transporter-like MFS transporter
MSSMLQRSREFLRSGHPGTLFTALLYFDFCFAVWVLNGAMAPFIAQEFHLSAAEKGFMVSVPVIAGALMRFPLGVLSQYIGRKAAAQVEMSLICVGLGVGYFLVDTYTGVLMMGVILGIAGASFGVALSLGSGWFPPKYKGLAMGIAGAGNSGAVLAVLFAPPLAATYGWKSVYGIAIFPMILAMILLQIFAKEPPDIEKKSFKDYMKILVDRDAWVFNLMYMLTFGGYIGLTSFLPTLFHDQYGIPKEQVGQYSAVIIIMASILRIVGGWMADRIGGLKLLYILGFVIIAATGAAAVLPPNPWVMVSILVVCFSAMGAGNGAVFQLVPLRFRTTTAVAGSLVGEIGALAGGFLPNAMGLGREYWGSFSPGFLSGTLLAVAVLIALVMVTKKWTSSWIGEGGKARPEDAEHNTPPSKLNPERARA